MAQVDWARRSMPLSAAAAKALRPGEGKHIGLAQPIDRASASMGLWLLEAGFKVSVLSVLTPPGDADLLAGLSAAGATICANRETFGAAALDILLDSDGAFLVEGFEGADGVKGAILTSAQLSPHVSGLSLPIIHIGASQLVELCVSTNGIGQASVSGFLDITNLQIAGSAVLVIGYGAVGKDVAKYARSYGARVTVCESDPLKAVEAHLDGHEIAQLDDALPNSAAIFHASQGGLGLELTQIKALPDGAFLCSATPRRDVFPLTELEEAAPGTPIRDHVTSHEFAPANTVKLVCEGLPIHTHAGFGLPLEYADVQTAAQLHSIAELAKPDCRLKSGLHPLSPDIETALAHGLLDNC